MLPYTILSVPDVDTSTLMRTALQKSKECYNCYGLNHYNTLCRHPKERKSSPFRTTSRPHYRKSSKGRCGCHSPSKHRQSHHRSPSPTNTPRSSHQPKRYRRPTRCKQVSHITSTTDSSPEGKLHMDVHQMNKHHSIPHFK